MWMAPVRSPLIFTNEIHLTFMEEILKIFMKEIPLIFIKEILKFNLRKVTRWWGHTTHETHKFSWFLSEMECWTQVGRGTQGAPLRTPKPLKFLQKPLQC